MYTLWPCIHTSSMSAQSVNKQSVQSRDASSGPISPSTFPQFSSSAPFASGNPQSTPEKAQHPKASAASHFTKAGICHIIPWDPCMVYLPTFTMKINQMQENKPYMDPMGIVGVQYATWYTSDSFPSFQSGRSKIVTKKVSGSSMVPSRWSLFCARS